MLTDIHGNVHALDAVIADARSIGCRKWWLLGDLVAMGARPAETVERLRDLDADVRLAGNTERYVLRDELPFPATDELNLSAPLVDQMVETAASFAWTKGSLSTEASTWLEAGSEVYRTELADGTPVVAVHASRLRDDGPGVDPSIPDADLLRLFPDVEVGLVIGGHTHQPTDREVGPVRFVNPGSVSNHPDGDATAKYLVIDDDPAGHRLNFRSVSYDVEAAVADLEASPLPGRGFVLETYFGR